MQEEQEKQKQQESEKKKAKFLPTHHYFLQFFTAPHCPSLPKGHP
jgi:hypothetical protein